MQDRVGERRALRRHRVNLVEVQSGTEQPARLGQLPVEGLDAVVFDLVHVGVGPPAGRVGVAPLAADHDIVDAGTAVQPVGEELLGEAIRAGHVEVAHAAGVPHVEELVGPLAQRVHGPLRWQVGGVPDVDVGRPAEGGKPKTDPGGRSRGGHAGEEGHRRYITPGQDLRRSRRSSVAWTPTTPDTAAVAIEIYRRSPDWKSAPSVKAGPTPRPRLSASTPPTSQTPTGMGQRIASPSARRRDNFQLGISVRLINA